MGKNLDTTTHTTAPSRAVSNRTSATNAAAAGISDRRPEAMAQRRMISTIQNSPYTTQLAARAARLTGRPIAQLKEEKNRNGMPASLQSGIESLSGMSMSDVKVHYNSTKPATLQAHAYAQGNDIHIASGQEKHLPHEAWHVVQQKQGRVAPTMQMAGVNINDDNRLEREADHMGARALNTIQRQVDEDELM